MPRRPRIPIWKHRRHQRGPVWRFLGEAWRSQWLGYYFVAAAGALALIWMLRVPPPGRSLIAMGIAAAIMALRADMRGREKWLWTFVLFAFAYVEVRALNQDRAEQQAFQNRLQENFASIGNGIKSAVAESDRNFGDTMSRLDTALAGIRDSIKTQTGGDSFAFVTFTAQPNQQFLVAITSHGRYPLRDIRVTLMDDERRLQAMQEYNKHPDGNWIAAIQSSDTYYQVPYLRPQSPEGPSGDVELLGSYPFGSKDAKDLTVAFSSFNGYWNERLHLRRVDGRWHQALSVIGPTVKQNLKPFIYSDSDYPEGRAIAERDWARIKPQSVTRH